MQAKTAWGLCNRAFAASRETRFPALVRRAFFQLGVMLFWMALAVEGRAREVWRDLRAQDAPRRPLSPRAAWKHCAGVLRRLVWRSAEARCPVVEAWSLPDYPRMRGLGLGRMWAVLCPFCHQYHTHSPGEGRCSPHCATGTDRRHYVLAFAGVLPSEHHTRFYRSVRAGLPRFLQQGPDPDVAMLDAVEIRAA